VFLGFLACQQQQLVQNSSNELDGAKREELQAGSDLTDRFYA
jgi:hypothetical protein